MIEAVAGFINSPLSYLSGMDDPWYLDLYRRSKIIVCVGQGAWEDEAIEDTRYLDFLFREKSVPAWIDYWGYDVKHDWPWWYKQMNHFLGCLYNRTPAALFLTYGADFVSRYIHRTATFEYENTYRHTVTYTRSHRTDMEFGARSRYTG